MDYEHIFAIVVKDLKEVFSSMAIYGPMIFIPIFFAITLPLFTAYVSKYSGTQIAARVIGVSTSFSLKDNLSFIKFFAVNILGPIFLTMPIITASVIAADSFAGERERKTAEALMSTPIKNTELLFGKMFASFIPALLLTIAVFIIYATMTNYIGITEFGTFIFPNESWYLMLLNAPFLALTTIGVVVIVSSRAKGIKEAQQISTLLILPVLVIPFISIFSNATLSAAFLIRMLILLFISTVVVIYLGVRFFNREGFITA